MELILKGSHTSSQFPSPLERRGKEKLRPAGTPYGLLAGTTPEEKQSPGGVGLTKERMASAILTAVEAAEERPHFFMRAPPLVATFGVKSFSNHELSSMTSDAALPLMRAFTQSGTYKLTTKTTITTLAKGVLPEPASAKLPPWCCNCRIVIRGLPL
jgi:hypothetical protein